MAMTVLDLAKATVVCAGLAYASYAVPAVSQTLVIGLLSLLWLLYARGTVRRLRRR